MAGGEFPYRDEGRSTLQPTRTGLAQGLNRPEWLLCAALTALTALVCYHRTLLPGLDFGDSASFQTGVGSLTLTPRQAYPLYYALGNVFAWLDPNEPAHAMNIASAVYGALAVGVIAWLAAELAESAAAGVAAGLLLAFSYTFWSQAITAEVYTLHLLIVGAALLALLRWSTHPAWTRLACFYAIYALGFGNHLSMILLLPGCAIFILLCRTPGTDDPLRPKAIRWALTIAFAASLQYLWNLRGLWWELEPPASFPEALGKFWFDVTKADWRESLVMGVSEAGLQNRLAMYWFDLRQQFGVPGIGLAGLGLCYLAARWPRRAILLLVLYLTVLAFAWTYNVGDPYIFFLPSHYIIALCAGAGVGMLVWLASRIGGRAIGTGMAALCCAYPLWRGYDTFPAIDRSWDNRAVRVFDQLTAPPYSKRGQFCHDAIFGLDANWQIQNAAEYYMRLHKPDVPWFTTDTFKWLSPRNPGGFSRFVDDNFLDVPKHPLRHVVLTPDALRNVLLVDQGRYQPVREDSNDELADRIAALPAGTVYVLGVLRPYREFPIDPFELERIWSALSHTSEVPPIDDYTIVIGRVGQKVELVKGSNRPFRLRVSLDRLDFDVRMESWLPTDTIRRSGFGHVIVNRTHALTLERGISLLAMGDVGPPLLTEYRAGLVAPTQRFVLGTSERLPASCYR